MSREINVVGVIGLGTMGAGIVEVFAKGGKRVIAVENTPELAERGRGFVAKSLDKAVSRGKLEQSARDEIVGRITFTHQMTDLADADLVVEAIPERMEFKRDVFGKLDEIVGEQAILASNTSSLSLTEIATHTKHPQRVVGMHFFNPAPVLALVEVITTIRTDDEVVTAIRDLATELGKKPVVVGDRAGFVANALPIPYPARAIRTYETGHVTREDLDAAGRLGIGLPMGPLTLSDLIGLDVVKEVCDVLYAATKEPSVAAPALLQQMVAAGRLGRKTGRGFYAYDGSETEAEATTEPAPRPASVAVLGDQTGAEQVLAGLRESGVRVQELTDPRTEDAVDADVVLLLDGPSEEDLSEDYNGWYAAALGSVPEQATVVVANPAAGIAAALHLPHDGTVVAASIHAPTRAGQLAEVARLAGADEAPVQAARGLFEAAGLTTIVARDRAGLVVDALLLPHLNDAARMLDSGYASAQDIDTAMTAGCGYPQGPFAYVDQLGPEYVIDGLGQMYAETGEQVYFPSPILGEQADSGRPFLR